MYFIFFHVRRFRYRAFEFVVDSKGSYIKIASFIIYDAATETMNYLYGSFKSYEIFDTTMSLPT